jgi:hypothetical protein
MSKKDKCNNESKFESSDSDNDELLDINRITKDDILYVIPLVDIYKDSEGLWQLDDAKFKLRDDIIRYFRERNEDCNVMPVNYKYCKGKWI